MTSNNDNEKNLEELLLQTEVLLSKTVDIWQEEQRQKEGVKNRVSGGYYMMSRAAEKDLRALHRANSNASLIFSVMR